MYKLVIVDDEPAIRNGIRQYFPWSTLGFDVVADFENGQLLFEYIAQQEVDVILTDIYMPVVDGIEIAKRIHQNKLPIKVVFLTGYKDFNYAIQAVNYGVKSYILKPTKYQELCSVFAKVRAELDAEPSRHAASALLPSNSSIIELVKKHVDENLASVTLETAASQVCLNPAYLSSYFHKQTGRKFGDYVKTIRMQHAAALLTHTDHSTLQICYEVGYSNIDSFSRAFKSFYQQSPKEYKRYVRNDDKQP